MFKRGKPYALLLAWRSGEFDLVIAKRQHDELTDVFGRPGIISRFILSGAELADLFLALAKVPAVTPKATLPVPVRDPNDEHILAAALDGNAGYLVTGDKALLALSDDPLLGSLKIISVADFLPILEERERTSPANR
ncbi:MAG: PIN domain-containing protein [Chloroflexota bacterium]|nr:PIN domain-containing protein [Chloroflexota bacterium]